MWKLSLDPTQKALITQLQASRETWHQTGTYNAEQYQEPPEVRRRDGASLRKALPHTAHAGWKPPKNGRTRWTSSSPATPDGSSTWCRCGWRA